MGRERGVPLHQGRGLRLCSFLGNFFDFFVKMKCCGAFWHYFEALVGMCPSAPYGYASVILFSKTVQEMLVELWTFAGVVFAILVCCTTCYVEALGLHSITGQV